MLFINYKLVLEHVEDIFKIIDVDVNWWAEQKSPDSRIETK